MLTRRSLAFAAATPLFALTSAAQPRPETWRDILQKRLALFGHRNWIVIADAAYPLQSGPGIETIESSEDQIATVRAAVISLRRQRHVRPVIYKDKELDFVPESDAPGINAYRQELSSFIKEAQPVPHDNLLHTLDEAGRSFNVLVIKTNTTLPYTSVFIELRAAYWSDEAEQRLRGLIRP